MAGTLIMAVMYSDEKTYCKARSILAERLQLLKESRAYSFDRFTHYYEKEMGSGLLKRFLVFNNTLDKKGLVDIKKQASAIEKGFSEKGRRKINIDPGYIDEDGLVLASFKTGTDYKEKLSDDVYAHKILAFKGKKAGIFWHTFPDYRVKENQDFFIKSLSCLNHTR
ncbi:DUF4416 family protein [Candidatus Woesearchaeota archaeon]|nr:DUF4416 family protein [Candidatus Woesearchaeota archaeon]